MIRAPHPHFLVPASPIHRVPLLLPDRPRFRRRPPLSACPAQTPTSTAASRFSACRLAPLVLLMDPAAPAPADADAETNGEPGGYADDSEFADAEAGSEPGMTAGGDEPRELPEELARGVVCLECVTSPEAMEAGEDSTCRIYVVGTAHVSQESCDQVKAVINYLKPQVVFLELCSSRVSILTPQNLQVPTMNEMIDMWKKKKMNTFGILYSWFLAKVASQLDVLPGAEFRVAFEEAMNYGGKVILGDRPVQNWALAHWQEFRVLNLPTRVRVRANAQTARDAIRAVKARRGLTPKSNNITLRRTWGKMSLWHRAKFLYYIVFQSLFLPSPEDLNKMLKDMDDVDMLTLVIQEMSKAFPSLMETLLHERDLYMSSKLLKVAREHSSVVAVVGKGHVSGIKKSWQQPIEVQSLLELPVTRQGASKMKILASVGALSAVIASGIYIWGKK